MAERLDRITIRLSSADVTIPWQTRQAILRRLGRHQLGERAADRDLRKAFDEVGASRPVTLTVDQKTYLISLLEQWSLDTVGGYAATPAEILTLRNALVEDLHDAGQPA